MNNNQSISRSFLQLDGKVAVVTGAGSGIGRATALTLAQEGARIAIGDMNVDNAEETAQLVRNIGGEAIVVATDISKADDVKRLVGKTVETYGTLDCAANVAGIAPIEGTIETITDDMWRRIIDVNLTGTFFCLREQTAAMKGKKGSIVIVASIGALIGNPWQPAYVSAKHGVLGLARSGSLEFGPSGIRINALCPGFTRTPMTESFFGDNFDDFAKGSTPLGRGAEPQEMADAIAWLCSERSSFVNGASIVVDGGQMVGVGLPGAGNK